jgi:REP element-mobilizing transposase RayT
MVRNHQARAAMTDSKFHEYRRRLPHWRLDGSVYFVTFRLCVGTLSNDEIIFIRDRIREGHGQWYKLLAVQVMPDHVHVILSPMPAVDLSRVMKGIKGSIARSINEQRGTTGTLWQDEYWDRVIRDEFELEEKLEYMLFNPVKAELTADPESWPGWYVQPETT